MTYFEKLEELKSGISITPENFRNDYKNARQTLATFFGEALVTADVDCKAHGAGTVTFVTGHTIEDLIAEVSFANEIRRFSVSHMINCARFIKFVDTDTILEMWNATAKVSSELAAEFDKHKEAARLLAVETEKKAEEEQKANERYEQLKKKALFDFNKLANSDKASTTVNDEFYYALGWLAKHVGSLTAILPDYLGPAFEQTFGTNTPKTLVDGRAKTSGGYAKQWSWEFKCTIKKLKETAVPVCIQSVTADFSKGIHNTSFLWDLVKNHGFQFGKEQDIDKIRNTIPTQYIDLFEAGMTA